ncbi:MAG TPA: pyridoxamine 5'-phosphate oxidase family protein [Dehalococcoidia bacterium]|jgi:nitroimidazol reductase NimA-like FMN-containing flavoprotein (pyridoxamine 5'-phosphate oxidase superfamily)
MQESEADIARLQALIDRGIAQAGPFLRSSFEMPEHSLSARQVIAVFNGNTVVALSTATASGEPRVAPIGCLLISGDFYIPTTRTAARYRMVARQPKVSLTAFEGVDLAVIVQGRARPLNQDTAEFARIDAVHVELGGTSPRGWGKPGDGCYLAIEPESIITYARYPERIGAAPEG